MFWGCITSNGVGCLIKCPQRCTSSDYIEVLEHASIQDSASFNVMFMDDNTPIHRAANVVAWKADRAVVSLNWPPRSPDLIPLENVWGIMKRRIRSLAKQPETLIDLEQCVVNEWNAISCKLLKNLYNGMKKRVFSCIQAKGYPIRK